SRWYSMRTTRTYLISSMGPLPTVAVTKQAGYRQAPPARPRPSLVALLLSQTAWTSLTPASSHHLHLRQLHRPARGRGSWWQACLLTCMARQALRMAHTSTLPAVI